MSYLKAPPIKEDRHTTAEVYDSVTDNYFTVGVQYVFSEWSEPHAYGDTTVYERMQDREAQWYELEGDECSREDLVQRFGEQAVQELEANMD